MIKGIKISTANSGAKYKNRDDLLLVTFEKTANVAGVFTQSSMAAAPVNWCRKIIKKGLAKALIVNSGNANAFTGKAGDELVQKSVEKISQEIGCEKDEIFTSSTGVIGEILDEKFITSKIPQMVQNLASAEDSFEKAARAIMTTDTNPKISEKTCEINGQKISLIGIAKGSGMIAPNMATMLGYVFTDANIESNYLQKLLKNAADKSFNSITVDTDQSTNDTVLLFASGAASTRSFGEYDAVELASFEKALNELTLDLAKKIVIDGEGAQKLIEVKVLGARTKSQAKETAFGVANSPLVKTAIAGRDPNWGRIIMAVGKSCSEALPEKIIVKIGDYVLTKNGAVNPDYIEAEVHQYLQNSEVKISIDLGIGSEADVVWTCDLNEEYIKINKDYRS